MDENREQANLLKVVSYGQIAKKILTCKIAYVKYYISISTQQERVLTI